MAIPPPAKPAAPPYNPNKSPKQRFTEMSQWVGEHRQMVDSVAFIRACDFSMMQYQQQVTGAVVDGTSAASAGLRLQGAIEFLNLLRNLSESPPAPPKRTNDNLNYA